MGPARAEPCPLWSMCLVRRGPTQISGCLPAPAIVSSRPGSASTSAGLKPGNRTGLSVRSGCRSSSEAPWGQVRIPIRLRAFPGQPERRIGWLSGPGAESAQDLEKCQVCGTENQAADKESHQLVPGLPREGAWRSGTPPSIRKVQTQRQATTNTRELSMPGSGYRTVRREQGSRLVTRLENRVECFEQEQCGLGRIAVG